MQCGMLYADSMGVSGGARDDEAHPLELMIGRFASNTTCGRRHIKGKPIPRQRLAKLRPPSSSDSVRQSLQPTAMGNTGKPSRACATCKKRKIKVKLENELSTVEVRKALGTNSDPPAVRPADTSMLSMQKGWVGVPRCSVRS